MSEIAKALANAAKITESGHLQRAHLKSAEAIRKNHTREFIWAGVLSCVGLIVIGAYLSRPDNTAPPEVIGAQTHLDALPPPDVIAAKVADPVLESQLANVVIKALIKGSNPRILIGDRVIGIGDELIPGLILAGIDSNDLIAKDERGMLYRKKM